MKYQYIHEYLLTFTEECDEYDCSQFLNEFEKLCNKHHALFNHLFVNKIRKEIPDETQENG